MCPPLNENAVDSSYSYTGGCGDGRVCNLPRLSGTPFLLLQSLLVMPLIFLSLLLSSIPVNLFSNVLYCVTCEYSILYYRDVEITGSFIKSLLIRIL